MTGPPTPGSLPPTDGAVGLVATGITVTRAGRLVLDDVDVSAELGAVLAVVGPSGSGKSTLLAVLAGLVPPDNGRVDRPTGRDGRSGVAIVLQGYGLLSVLTAAENVELPLQLAGRPRAETADRAASALARVGLDEVGDRLVEELSGGQQQRVAIARALAVRPVLLVADEPTAELDETTAGQVLSQLRAEAADGAVVVLATHDPSVTARADARLDLADGHLDPH